MPKKNPSTDTIDQIEQDFIDALKRIQKGKPSHHTLKKANELGRLKISITNVAMEAARSRTLIGMENCRYPRIRDLVKQAKGTLDEVPTTHTELIRRLREEITILKSQRAQYQAESLAQLLERNKAEKEALRERTAANRLRKELEKLGKMAEFRLVKPT